MVREGKLSSANQAVSEVHTTFETVDKDDNTLSVWGLSDDTVATVKNNVTTLLAIVEPDCSFDPNAEGVTGEELLGTYNRLVSGLLSMGNVKQAEEA
jgi:hypothetical protein